MKKKLIEVALPLEAINEASRKEKNPFIKNHPRALHVWWARRPLAACRAVLFASLVDDPSSHPDKFLTEEAQEKERQRLFRIIEDIVKWENTTNEKVLQVARDEIRRSCDGNPPAVLDPFCGGGSIPLEAQRLGLEAYASDLNPVAVLITKALIEIPSKFADRPPVNPEARKKLDHSRPWQGVQGLVADIQYYGDWIHDEAEKRIGHLYPAAHLPKAQGGGEVNVIAWLWARTVRCPNPACNAQMPLVRSFWLSTKKGKEAWISPVVDRKAKTVRFEVKTGAGSPPEGTKKRGSSRCLICGTDNIIDSALREQAKQHGIGSQLIAVVAGGERGRSFLDASVSDQATPGPTKTEWLDQPLPDNARWFSPPGYGLRLHRDLYTPRQTIALSTFSDLVSEARERVLSDAEVAGMPAGTAGLNLGASGAIAYADAIATYLGLCVSRFADFSNAICSWDSGNTNMRQLFARQAIPMAWDFAETNPLHGVVDILAAVGWATSALAGVRTDKSGSVKQLDATAAINSVRQPMISTDPPYYDNIGYADLSDFFYVWLRRSIGKIYPDLFSTVLTPKAVELIATPYRFGGDREKAERFFEEGLGRAFVRMREVEHPDYPLTVYYAFKQAEEGQDADSNDAGRPLHASTGWDTMLEGLLKAGFAISGTWPMRTEQQQRSVATGTNALASSIVLVCRPRKADAALATRREFLNILKRELPDALRKLQEGNIAPVDLAQAAIGPGMAVFSRYSKVVEADGSQMQVRTALGFINQTLDEVLAEQESEFDADTRWALAWFEQFGMQEASFGVAEILSKAKNTAVSGLVDAGILAAKAGKVRLLKRSEMPPDWDPSTGRRITVWEVTQHLIRALEQDGEAGAGSLLRRLGSLGEVARDLAYRLFSLCDRKKWAQEALAYNSLVIAWPEIARLAKGEKPREQQAKLSL